MAICTPFTDVSNGRVTVCTSGTRPTGSDRYTGKVIYETDTEALMIWDGAAWVQLAELGTWTAYNSYATTGLTVGNGVKAAQYLQMGAVCYYKGSFTLGTTSAVTGDVTIGLPLTAASIVTPSFNCSFYDLSGTTYYPGQSNMASTTVVSLRAINTAGTYGALTALTSLIPFTWASGDIIYWAGSYEVA